MVGELLLSRGMGEVGMTRASKISIGKAVKQAREKRGLSQDKICAKVNICKPAYIRIEKGVRFPRYDKMWHLIKHLQVKLPHNIA